MQTDDNNEFADGLDTHGAMTADGEHPLVLTATYSIGLIKDLSINVLVKPFITQPASPATQYYVIGSTPKIELTLDYSSNVPVGRKITLDLLQEDGSALPDGITKDISTDNQIKIIIE